MTTTTAPAAGAVEHRQPSPVRRPSLARLTVVELRKLVDTRAGRWLLITIGLIAAVVATLQLIYAEDADQTFANFFVPSLLPVGCCCRCSASSRSPASGPSAPPSARTPWCPAGNGWWRRS
ncbi:hypothetical protein GCM10027614_62440 [Micromonospora vulcania]